MNKRTIFLIGPMAAIALGSAVAAGDGTKEANTALIHAQMAAAATDLKTVHLHLRHVVNCLVGTSGKGFDASAGDPCEGMGDGALNDSVGDKALHAKLEAVLREADLGLKDKNYVHAKKTVDNVIEHLKDAEMHK